MYADAELVEFKYIGGSVSAVANELSLVFLPV